MPAVALFLKRARATARGLALGEENARAVAELCVHPDGLPLAIELAAARTDLLSLRMILDRLGYRLSLLRWEARDLPPRHKTLRSAIGWSYDSLDEPERPLFRRLGVFPTGFAIPIARAVPALGNGDGGHERQKMETAYTRTAVAVVGVGHGPAAASYPAGSGANAALSALFTRAPRLGGRAAARNIHTSLTDRGSA